VIFCQDGYAHGGDEFAVILQGRQRLGKNHVGARVPIQSRARDSQVHSFAGDGIRPGHDDKAGIFPAVRG